MGLPVMGKIKPDQKGMLLIEIILILLLVIALMKAGFETYLSPYKEAVQNIQKQRIVYNGKRLWNR
jgi:hypothetical protein